MRQIKQTIGYSPVDARVSSCHPKTVCSLPLDFSNLLSAPSLLCTWRRIYSFSHHSYLHTKFSTNLNAKQDFKFITMCRGFQRTERDRLRIRSFTASVSGKDANSFPDALTLHYLPRINGSLIELNGSDIRPDSPAFVTLHRLCAEETVEAGGCAAVYASRERVSVLEGAMFEIYVWDVKAMRGIFRRHEDGERWRMECKAAEDGGVEGVTEAEVVVEAEGEAAAMREKVVMEARRRRRSGCCKLAEIPEVREEGERGSDVCRCSECSGQAQEGIDGRDCGMEDLEVESVGWAVDVGIWVVCLGVGYLVSRASSRSLRKRFL